MEYSLHMIIFMGTMFSESIGIDGAIFSDEHRYDNDGISSFDLLKEGRLNYRPTTVETDL